ncbi:hypothetical protein PFY12_05695 [Chryseobacterium camelliae]|uniref:Uncharacterized protein n=1 Tax=Chryseobacterium camelliae TaxID=1265445 RepID=A0ABY7QQM8_9FLAO|nr:hypothetical protein [Chryseobacterium camelliae]WBV61614.1 hypothetical protein PFY12_05695 [Chryseobacterium camelliae]
MKIRVLLLLSFSTILSCYSPKTEVEEDKYPEIPDFPSFTAKNIQAGKVIEIPLSQKDNCYFLVKDNYFFIYSSPVLNSENDYRTFIIKDGQLIFSDQWKGIQKTNNLTFLDQQGNFYANTIKYFAPDYSHKKHLPTYDIEDITKKYEPLFHLGEAEKDSALLKKIKTEQITFQKNILGKINQILLIPSDNNTKKVSDHADYGSNYLCNSDHENPFFVTSSLFKEVKNPISTASEEKDPLYIKFHSKIKISPWENNSSSTLPKKDRDSTFFVLKDKSVSGNQWHSQGNHFVASFGYNPVYTYYYNIQFNNKVISTKENNTKMIISEPIKTGSGRYFLVSNMEVQKFQVYFLKN